MEVVIHIFISLAVLLCFITATIISVKYGDMRFSFSTFVIGCTLSCIPFLNFIVLFLSIIETLHCLSFWIDPVVNKFLSGKNE